MANDGWETISPSSTPSTANKDSGWETIVPNSTRPEMEHRDPFAYARKAAHAGVRATGEGVVPGLAGLAGASAGAAAMAVPAGYAAALSGPAGPIVGAALELVGAGVGAYWGAEGVASIQDKLHQLIAPEDYEMRKQQKKDFHIETTIGNIAGSSIGLSPKAAFDPAAKFINTANKARVASGVAQGAISAGTQYATNNEISPVDTALAVATGVALPGVNRIGKPAAALGHMVGGVFNPKPKAPGKEPPPQVPPEGSPPEVIEEFKKQLKERAKLTQTAIRDKATGEIELMGPKHDEARKAETKDTHDQGFVDQLGNFYDRKEALDKAIKTGMIPKDHPLEFPNKGLRSGDLRKAGVKAFEVAPEAPKAPVTREEHKSRIKELDDQLQSLETVDIPNAEHNKDPALESLRKQAEAIQNEKDSLQKSIPEVQFKDKNNPTWEESHDLLWDARTYGDAIDRLLASGAGGKGQRLLLEILGKSDYIRNATFSTHDDYITYHDKNGVEKKNAVGLYTPRDKTNTTGHHVTLGKNGSMNTFLHEGIHAATHALIESGRSNAAKELKQLYDTSNAEALKEYQPKLDTFKQANPNATPEQLEAHKEQHLEYGFTDIHEFITEAFIQDSFRKWLSARPYDPTRHTTKLNNMWLKFKAIIANHMGLTDRTLLDDVLDTGIELINKSSEKGFKAPGTSTAPISSPQEGVTKNIDYYRSSPNRLSQEVHDDLQDWGIPVAHSSPHAFGVFNWIKHALTGEGGMAFSAGTYHSSSDASNRNYLEMSKAKAIIKKFDPDGVAEQIEDILNDLAYEQGLLQDLEKQISAFPKTNLLDKVFRSENLKKEQELLKQQQEKKEHIEWLFNGRMSLENALPPELKQFQKLRRDLDYAKRNLDRQEIDLTRDMSWGPPEFRKVAEEALDALKAEVKNKQRTIDDYRKSIGAYAYTYHSTLKVKPEEILNWNSTKQSDLVFDAFRKLGIGDIDPVTGLPRTKPTQEQRSFLDSLKSDANWKQNLDGSVERKYSSPGGRSGTLKIEPHRLNAQGEVDSYLLRVDGLIERRGLDTIEQAKEELIRFFNEDVFKLLPKTGEDLYRELQEKFRYELSDEIKQNTTNREQERIAESKASVALAEMGVFAQKHNAQGGTQDKYPNYVVYDDSKVHINYVERANTKEGEFLKEVEEKASPSVAKAAEKVDPRSIPFDREEDFYNHAINIHTLYGEEAAIKFFEDWNAYKKEQAIPIPTDNKGLDDSLHIMDTLQTRDKSEHVTSYTKNKNNGVTDEQQEDWFMKRERGEAVAPEGEAILKPLDEENIALVKKAKELGLEVGEEFESGQSRIRIYGGVTTSWKKMISELFANRTPLGEKVADQANAAIERKVYGIEGTDRVIEIHRVAEDKTVNYRKTRKENGKEVPYGPWITRDMKRGTEFWEWRDGKKTLVGHSDDINFKLGQEFKDKTGEMRKMSTAKVPDIEAHSHYRYLHNAEISARLANMGLRKMVRDAEFLQGLMKSEMFKTVGHSPEQDLKTLPKGWRVPDNIDRIPQLRGWHFDPKTAAIIEDFAKVWDNTLWMKMTNQVVKNLMLNPLPHMFNEVMHLWNARGFSGWVPLTGGLSRLSRTGKAAWESVGKQDAFYREVMREGGSVLGADPRNHVFDQIILKAGKELNDDPPTKNAIASLAKKMGTSVGDFYNSWSKASQKAMWFTRDVMYMQYLMEVKELHQKRTGQEMSTKEAIEEAEKHMPNYRMPSEVLNSRGLAKVLKNPNITMFSRYHYGMVKSLVNTLKDVDPRNLKSPEGRQHFKDGVDTLMAIGVAMGALYPLMNWMAEQMFGEGAEQRQAGPYHLLHAGVQVAKGERDASALIWPMFSFNPMLLTLGQLAFNKKIFTGKQIYHPEDSIPDIAKDIGSYGVKQIPQAPPIMGAISEEGGAAVTLARQLDIQAKTPEQKARIDRAKKREERSAKARKTKREKGTYTP